LHILSLRKWHDTNSSTNLSQSKSGLVMSKLQSNIQKAIEKSRYKRQSDASNYEESLSHSFRRKTDAIASGIFRIFQVAKPSDAVMESSRIIAAIDDRAAKSAYNVLRTRVLQRMRSNNWHSILITSPGPGEGKTLTASNLAISLARDVNQSVILVDLDLMRSSIAKYLGINVDIQAGVGDYLLEKAELSEIIYSPGEIERLALVPNREPVDNSSDLLGSPKMKELISWLRQQSERSIVIFDMPPVLACDDVLTLCPSVDAVLVVVAQGKTERVALEKSMKLLSDYAMLGVVLNMSEESAGDSGYGYY